MTGKKGSGCMKSEIVLTSANSDFGYVTLCDTMEAMALHAKDLCYRFTTDKFGTQDKIKCKQRDLKYL